MMKKEKEQHSAQFPLCTSPQPAIMNPNSVGSVPNDAPCQAGSILEYVYQVVSNCDCLLFAAGPQVCSGFLHPLFEKPLPVAETIDSTSVVRVN